MSSLTKDQIMLGLWVIDPAIEYGIIDGTITYSNRNTPPTDEEIKIAYNSLDQSTLDPLNEVVGCRVDILSLKEIRCVLRVILREMGRLDIRGCVKADPTV